MFDPGDANDASQRRNPRRPLLIAFVMLGLGGLVLLAILFRPPAWADTSLPYSVFLDEVAAGHVAKVTIAGQRVSGEFGAAAGSSAPSSTSSSAAPASRAFETVIPADGATALIDTLRTKGVTIQVKDAMTPSGVDPTSLLWLVGLPILLIGGLMFFSKRGPVQMNAEAFGRSRARDVSANRPSTTFADVASEDEAKAELLQVVDFLRSPAKYRRLGARLPRGVLLVGPPGTGKTLLARAVAGEANVPFFSASSSEFVEMFVGVGASRVRDLFQRARQSAPAIVYLDELDAIGRRRGAAAMSGNDEREQTLNQLLIELDGFDGHEQIVVLASTNRPDVLDAALLRPGRFDRQVVVGLPDRRGREAILRVHAARIVLDPAIDLGALAAATPGFAGADLANLINEAALIAARHDRQAVIAADLDAALDRVVLGTERPLLIGPREREVIAYHEAGHALVAHHIPGADPVRKISIIARGQALGVTIQAAEEDRVNHSRDDLLGRLAVLLGGRGAEELVFRQMTTGAQNDLKEATSLARRMVGLWGMSAEIGPYFLGLGEQHAMLGYQGESGVVVSDQLLARADDEVQLLLAEARRRAADLLVAERARLDLLATALLERETLGPADILDLLGAPALAA
ncbi:MAG: ATP-dependent zinc metalloprotease FtsH [Thermomicrobiales bacterium]